MLKKEKIDRINHLAKKSKQEGLTEAEKEEQAVLRKEFPGAVQETFESDEVRRRPVRRRTGQTAKGKRGNPQSQCQGSA